LEILPANRIDLLKNLQLERSLALSAALFLRDPLKPRAAASPTQSEARTRIGLQAWLFECWADASVIKHELVQEHGVDPAKIEVIGQPSIWKKFKPPRDRMKFRREISVGANVSAHWKRRHDPPDKGQLISLKLFLWFSRATGCALRRRGTGTGILRRGST